MTALFAYLVVVVAFAAVCCGHVGEDWPMSGACAWLRGRLAAVGVARAVPEGRGAQDAAGGRRRPRDPADTPCAALSWRESAPQAPGGGFHAPDHPSAPERRTAAHVPTWAQPDTKEAA